MSLVGNVGVAVNNVFPNSVELKTYYVIHCSQIVFTTSAILAIGLVLDSIHFHHLVALSYLTKIHQSVSVYSQ